MILGVYNFFFGNIFLFIFNRKGIFVFCIIEFFVFSYDSLMSGENLKSKEFIRWMDSSLLFLSLIGSGRS